MLLSHVPGYFKSRRDALMKAHPGAIFLIPAARECVRNSDVSFPFRQESSFYYLSGFDEPDAFLVLAPTSTSGAYKTVLFVRRRDPEKEMWEGERYGTEGAVKVFGADEAYPVDEFDRKFPDLLKGADRLYYRMGTDETTDRRILAALEVYRRSMGRSGKSFPAIADPNEPIGEMRLFKSPEEIELIRKACQITALAHKTAMQEVRPGMNEYEIDALLSYVFRKNGCQRAGYDSIVAGGKNAACLHYRFNNDVLNEGDLLLVDAGGEYHYYTSDITRTFPVGGRFSEAQGRAYDLVLKAQLEAISMARPGAKLPDIHRQVCESLTDGLLSMGLLKGKPEEVLQSGTFRRFYPHNTSHWLGLDVHDVGLYMKDGQPRELESGMVFTIEPGFYIQPADTEVPEEYRNIGIRIEDDILITKDGCEVLTRDAPKSRADIESLRS